MKNRNVPNTNAQRTAARKAMMTKGTHSGSTDSTQKVIPVHAEKQFGQNKKQTKPPKISLDRGKPADL